MNFRNSLINTTVCIVHSVEEILLRILSLSQVTWCSIFVQTAHMDKGTASLNVNLKIKIKKKKPTGTVAVMFLYM